MGIRRSFRPRDVDRRVDEELSHHFERSVADLVRRGYAREAAEAEARRRFGDVGRYRSELESIDRAVEQRRRIAERIDVVRQSVHFAARSLARAPGLSLGIILAFALGIGANLTMYGVVDRLLLRAPEHVVLPDAVKRIFVTASVPYMSERFAGTMLSYPDYRELTNVSAFESVAAVAPRDVTLGSGLTAAEKPAAFVTGSFFGLVGVQPALGRFFTPEDDRPGGPQQVVLSWSAWQEGYAGAPDVIGRTVDFGYGAYEIIGVAPRHFTGVDLTRVDLWLPFHVVGAAMRGTEWLESRGEEFFYGVARLANGVTGAAASDAATAAWVAAREGTEWSGDYRQPRIELAPVLQAQGPDAPPESRVARLLLLVSVVVLLIAAVNVANLLLARSLRQRREIAVRLALGISRRRLIGQILLEGVMLAALGGTAALLIASWGGEVLTRLMVPDVEWTGGLNVRVLGVTMVLSLLAGIASALPPAMQAVRGTLSDTLRQAGAGGITRGAARFRIGLALAQTALSALLLVGAGLFVRSLDRVADTDYGFEPRNLVYAVARPTAEGIPAEQMRDIMERGRESLARVPGVSVAAISRALPFYSFSTTRLRAEGVDSMPVPETGGPFLHEVSQGYMRAMDLSIVAGRDFDERDTRVSQPVAIVNRSMADALWPGASPIGRCLYVGQGENGGLQTRCSEIIGVVEDARRANIAEGVTFQYYLPTVQQQTNGQPQLFVMRTADESARTLTSIRQAILALDPRIRFVEAEPMIERISPRARSWRLGAAVFSIFGALALVVASIGLYSVLAFDVAQRTREIGVRSALGASRRSVMRLVLSSAIRITSAGVVAGLVAALLLSPRISPLLYETSPRDPLTFGSVVLLLHVVAAVAAVVPAWRASRVHPGVALRSD